MDLKENTSFTSGFTRHPWERARSGILWYLIGSKLKGITNRTISVLDIGSGDLYQSVMLAGKIHDIRITALDNAYDERVKEELSDMAGKHHIRLVDSLQQIPETEHFDLVLMMDVLEHIEQDKEYLKLLVNSKFFDDHTMLVITVPAWKYLFSGHDMYLGHYRRYTRKQLLQICRDAGLQTHSSGYYFIGFYLVRVLQFSFHRIFGYRKKEASDLKRWKEAGWISRVISGILIVDYLLLRLLSSMGVYLPGLSAYTVCRKRR